MDRLTKNVAASTFKAVPVKIDLDFAFELDDYTWLGLQEIFDRLADYEDIGLTPEEIKTLAAIDGGLAMNTDQCAHKIFKALPPRRASGVICPHCGTLLAVAYHEERLYSVKCVKCETITLVKAKNPNEAAGKCGYQISTLEVKA